MASNINPLENMEAAECEQRGVKRGAEVVLDTQEQLGHAANKIANTAADTYHTVADAVTEVVVPQAHKVVETVKAKTADAVEAAQDAAAILRVTTGPAVEAVKEKAAAAVETAKGAAETVKGAAVAAAETVREGAVVAREKSAAALEVGREKAGHAAESAKENLHLAREKSAAALENAREKTAQTVETAKERASQTMENMKEVAAESYDIARKNVMQASEVAKDVANKAAQKGADGLMFVKGVGEGAVGAATGSVTEADTVTISRPIPSSEVKSDLPPMAESGINFAKAQELSEHFPNKTMDAHM